MNKLFKLSLIAVLAGLLLTAFCQLTGLDFSSEISQHYIDHGLEQTGALNLVTAILFDYRGFDTLGEATVILAAAASLSFLVPRKKVSMLSTRFTIIVYQTIIFIIPLLAILGLYLIFFGHLSPGGGFTGGVVLATIPIVLTITYGLSFTEKKFSPAYKTLVESSGALIFVLLGITGILAGSTFLSNARAGFGPGKPGDLLSSGIIPYLNLAVGLKVGTGLAIIFNSLIKED